MTERQADDILVELFRIRRTLDEISSKLERVLPPKRELSPGGDYELVAPPPEGG